MGQHGHYSAEQVEDVIVSVTASEVLAGCRRTLGLPEQHGGIVDDVLLAGLLRRSAGMHCPCSRATLRASVLECTQALSTDHAALPQRIDDAIEALTLGGDLLELDDVATEDSEVRQTWLFAAPPGFVIRPNGAAFLFGVVPDQDAFLPSSLGIRVLHDGFARSIEPRPGENLPAELREQGLQQLSDSAWLKSPRTETPSDMLDRVERRLAHEPAITAIDNLKILDSARPVTYYPDRWVVPTSQSGTFVARRPQEFSAPMWCLVRMEAGAPVRLLDLPFERTRWRGCDTAWHLQMAIDYCRHSPQRYRRRVETHGVRFDFFSPLPQWSQRRLMIFGKALPRDRSLLSYRLPPAEARTEEGFLRDRLWLSRTEDSE